MKLCTANIIFNDEGKILLLKRAPNDSFHPSTWCLPGGGLEPKEKPIDGVKRETFEESGINQKLYTITGTEVVKLPEVTIHYFVSEMNTGDIDDVCLLDEKEHCNYEWCDYDNWKDKDLILDLKKHLTEILKPDILEKGMNKHVKFGIDKNGHQYQRKVNDVEESIKKEHKVAESTKKPPLWMEKFKDLKLNKTPPIDLPENKIVITYKKGDDPHSKSLMHWVDPKTNRRQDSYTTEFLQRNAEVKWQRIASVNHKIMDTIKLKCKNAMDVKDNQKLQQSAAAILIIAETGLRTGNLELLKVTGNKGVTTLAPDDITVKGDVISFNFKGKSHKQNVSTISDVKLAAFLKALQKKNKDKQFLFDITRHDANSTFKDTFGFKGLKLKDMRTYIATSMSKDILNSFTDETFLDLIKDAKNVKAIINKKLSQVYEAVSQKLNNTPAMAKNAYIHPNVKKDWLALIGVTEDQLNKSVIELYDDRLKDLLYESSLDTIIKKYPASKEVINIDEEDEENCDLYPMELWELNEESIEKAIEEAIDINKSFLMSDEHEKKRSINEYQWELKSQEIKKGVSKIPVSSIPIKDLYKSMVTALLDSSYDNKELVDAETPITVIMNKGENIETNTGQFMTWLKHKSGDKRYDEVGMPEAKKIIIKCNENPYLHFLAKGMTAMDEEFVTENSILSFEAYESLSKGIDIEVGIWNTDLEKAKKDLSKYKMVRKLVYRDGKSYITTVYVSNDKDASHITGEKTIELHSDPKVHLHAKAGLKVGDSVSFMDKGALSSGTITGLKHHPITDKFGTAVIKASDGKTYTKSLKLVFSDDSSASKTESTAVTDKMPDRLTDLTISSTTLGGSGDVRLATDKNGKKWVLKRARIKDGVNVNEQLKQSVLADKLYSALGIKTAKSSYFQEKNVGYKISEFIDGTTLGAQTKPSLFYKAVQEGFVMDCLLGNWDVIGTSKDNILIGKTGDIYRIDNDGSMQFRAQGRKKTTDQFDKNILEFQTFLDGTNASAFDVFTGVKMDDIKLQGEKIINKSKELLKLIDNSDVSNKSELKNIFMDRLNTLSEKISRKEPAKEKLDYDKSKYSSKVTADYFKDWDKLELEGNPEIKEGIKKHILEVEKDNERTYKEWAGKHGLSVEEYKAKLQKLVEDLVAKSDFFRATDLGVLDKVLNEDGRYKTQFEVGTSHGTYAPMSRSNTENKYFAFKNDVKHEKTKRPVYGYFSDNPNGVQNTEGSIPPPNHASYYGEVTVKIKREMAMKKATVTFRDSLGGAEDMAATPAAKPHFTSFYTGSSDPLSRFTSTSAVSTYTEAQYHNQLKIEDMESVHYSQHSSYHDERCSKLNQIIEITRKTHLPIKIFVNK